MHSKVPVGMIDILKMIRDSFSGDEFRRYLFEDEGGSSHHILK